MPSGIYLRNKKNTGCFQKGQKAFNKGIECQKKLKKIEKYRLGLPVECKKHGEHLKWRLIASNNIQCVICAYEWQKNRRKKNPLKFLHQDAMFHSKAKNRDFFLSIEDLESLLKKQKNKCALTGMAFNDENMPSLDRIDPIKGYEVNNIQFVNIRINRMKSDMRQDEFIELCRKLAVYSVAGKSKPKKK